MTRGALDNMASKVSPRARETRAARYRLRDAAARLLGHERVAKCGRRLVHSLVTVRREAGRAFYGGLQTCSSVWHCPVCAARIGEVRRREVEEALDAHAARGGHVYMATMTVPHHAFSSPAHLRSEVATAWRKLAAGAPWLRIKRDFGIVGMVRGLETTHGRNGWHPHLHVLLFTRDLTADEAAALADRIYERWERIVERMGLGTCWRSAFSFERARERTAAGRYVSKWGCDAEIALSVRKSGRTGQRSPWDLLAAAEAGDETAARLFQEYAAAFKGARQLTWTRGLRALFGLDEIVTDDEAAAEPAVAEAIGGFDRVQWRWIVCRRLASAVLDAAEDGGWQGVLNILRERGCPYVNTLSSPGADFGARSKPRNAREINRR